MNNFKIRVKGIPYNIMTNADYSVVSCAFNIVKDDDLDPEMIMYAICNAIENFGDFKVLYSPIGFDFVIS